MELDGGIIYKLILSVVLGGFIGLERQMHQTEEDAAQPGKGPFEQLGLRTFAFISLLGTLVGFSVAESPLIATFITGFVFLLTLGFYFFDSWYSRDYGITTELAVAYMYFMGFFIGYPLISLQLVIALTIVAAVVLSRKDKIKAVTDRIRKNEVRSFTSYLVIALVILPLLPDHSFSAGEIPFVGDVMRSLSVPKGALELPFINPFSLWLYVALITGVDVAGYILERTVGKSKGWLLTSTVAGFISSTALTFSIAKESKKSQFINILVSGAIIANLASFIQLAVLIAPLNPFFFSRAFPVILAMLLTGAGIVWYYYRKRKKGMIKVTSADQTIESKRLFHLYPALKFVGIYLVITTVSKIAYALFGETGFLISMGLAALSGMDAVVIALSQFAGSQISLDLALFTFVIANTINLLVKSVYAFIEGNRIFAQSFLTGVAAITAAGFIAYYMF